MEEQRVSDIVWREDLYPRFEPNAAVIQQYAQSLNMLPPVEVNQRNELIDGFHRWKAHQKEGRETIAVTVTETVNDREFRLLAIRRNATHGLQLTNAEKKHHARMAYTGAEDKEELAQLFGVSSRTMHNWLQDADKALKEERDRKIASMWLACYTEGEIAEAAGIGRSTVAEMVQKPSEIADLQKATVFSTYSEPNWKPPLYDVWAFAKSTNKVRHGGNSEVRIVDNLLYLYTKPFDIVVDPFAGGGSTIDVCKKRLRRYWVSDYLPAVEREHEIRKADALGGPAPLRQRWPNVKLLYLDPPYWKQALGMYGDSPNNLANMELDRFYDVLTGYIAECAKKMHAGSHIALIIQPTQWNAPNRQTVDHIVDVIMRLSENGSLHYKRRISVPYSTQQYNAQQVNWAKENKDILGLGREVIIWATK